MKKPIKNMHTLPNEAALFDFLQKHTPEVSDLDKYPDLDHICLYFPDKKILPRMMNLYVPQEGFYRLPSKKVYTYAMDIATKLEDFESAALFRDAADKAPEEIAFSAPLKPTPRWVYAIIGGVIAGIAALGWQFYQDKTSLEKTMQELKDKKQHNSP